MDKTFVVYETYKIDEPYKNYIGKTSMQWIKDGYLGSGTNIKLAMKKYGREMFNLRILKEFDSEAAAYEYETSLEVHKNGFYNIAVGGAGFASGDLNPMRNEEVKAKVVGKRLGKHLRQHLTKEIIMPFVEKGWDRNKIARHFGCSPHTIKARILDKPIRQVWEENNGKTKWQEKAIAEGRTRYRKRFDGKGGSWVHPVPEKWKQKAASCKKTCAERRRVR